MRKMINNNRPIRIIDESPQVRTLYRNHSKPKQNELNQSNAKVSLRKCHIEKYRSRHAIVEKCMS